MRRTRGYTHLLTAVAIIVAIILVGSGCGDSAGLTPDAPGPAENIESGTIVPEASQTPPRVTLEPEPSTTAPTPTPTPAEDIGTATPRPTATMEEPPTQSLTPTEAPSPTPTREPVVPRFSAAAEIAGITAWINSQPLKIADLAGKVVLIDFWTYTCVNCIRTFPYLKTWHAKYADDGLVIVGIHSPEFNFEKKLENVRRAVEDYGIGWAVALDNDFETWRAFKNRAWPAKYLIDKDGNLRYTHLGEGAYAETERIIRQVLEEAGADLSGLDSALPKDQTLDPAFLNDPSARPTRELYAGWERGYSDAFYGGGGFVEPAEYYSDADVVVDYEDPGEHAPHKLYLQGPWLNGPESLTHARETTGFEDHMALRFSAKSVNVVINPAGEAPQPFKVLVSLDGEHMTAANKGEDVVIEEDGRSFLHVDGPRMYSVVQAPSFATYELTLSSKSPNFAVFAFTFGFYESGI